MRFITLLSILLSTVSFSQDGFIENLLLEDMLVSDNILKEHVIMDYVYTLSLDYDINIEGKSDMVECYSDSTTLGEFIRSLGGVVRNVEFIDKLWRYKITYVKNSVDCVIYTSGTAKAIAITKQTDKYWLWAIGFNRDLLKPFGVESL